MEVVINVCYGGFGISKKAAEFLAARGNKEATTDLAAKDFYGYACSDDRSNKDLIDAVKTLGSKAASGMCAALKVVEIPDGVDWEISEYDGNERIAQRHQTWC